MTVLFPMRAILAATIAAAFSCAGNGVRAPATSQTATGQSAPTATDALPVPSTANAAPTHARSPCDDVRELVARVLGSAGAADPKLVPFGPQDPATGRCLPAQGGTWALALTSLKVHTDDDIGNGVSGTFELFHADPRGQLVSATPPPLKGTTTNYLNVLGDTGMTLHEPVLFDFDGDGSDEIIVYGEGGYHEGESFTFGTVWTFREGAVVPYPPAANIQFDEVRDATGDGRPDLLFHGVFDSVVEISCSGFGHRATGPLFVAHAREDGTFSVSDAAALAAIRKECPTTPRTIVAMRADDPGRIDDELTFKNVACARVWGVPTPQLKASITSSCRSSKARIECDEKRGECPQQAELLDWATRTPPLAMPRPSR